MDKVIHLSSEAKIPLQPVPEMGKKENILENIICILISYQQDKIPSISFSTIW